MKLLIFAVLVFIVTGGRIILLPLGRLFENWRK